MILPILLVIFRVAFLRGRSISGHGWLHYLPWILNYRPQMIHYWPWMTALLALDDALPATRWRDRWPEMLLEPPGASYISETPSGRISNWNWPCGVFGLFCWTLPLKLSFYLLPVWSLKLSLLLVPVWSRVPQTILLLLPILSCVLKTVLFWPPVWSWVLKIRSRTLLPYNDQKVPKFD